MRKINTFKLLADSDGEKLRNNYLAFGWILAAFYNYEYW